MVNDSRVREMRGVRLSTVCGPALTGTTVCWCVHAIFFTGALWAPPVAPQDLLLLWFATGMLGVVFASLRKLSTLTAAGLSTWGGATLGLAHVAALFFMQQPKMAGMDYVGSFAMMAVAQSVTVTLSGILWMPAIWLSWKRHHNRARDLQRAFSHA